MICSALHLLGETVDAGSKEDTGVYHRSIISTNTRTVNIIAAVTATLEGEEMMIVMSVAGTEGRKIGGINDGLNHVLDFQGGNHRESADESMKVIIAFTIPIEEAHKANDEYVDSEDGRNNVEERQRHINGNG